MAYRILIVDDEEHAVEAIQCALDWEALGIGEVYTAFNGKLAKDIFLTHSIDMMLCDIEMPGGNGIELMEWVSVHSPHTVSICLTCHAEFFYAQKILQLGGAAYILKPIPYDELTLAIRKGMDKLKRESESRENSHYRSLWDQHHDAIIEKFWVDLLDQAIPSNPDAIAEEAKSRGMPFSPGLEFMPILVEVQRWKKKLSSRELKIMEYALRNAIEEMILSKAGRSSHLVKRPEGLIAMLVLDDETDIAQIKADCESYIASVSHYFFCDLSCYIGIKGKAHELVHVICTLQETSRNNVSSVNKVFSPAFNSAAAQRGHISFPDMKSMSILLQNGDKPRLLHELVKFLDGLVKSILVGTNELRQFQYDFLQMIHAYLQTQGIQAHRLFMDEMSTELIGRSTKSIADMKEWVEHVIDKSVNHSDLIKEKTDIVKRVKEYVARNIDGDLSRKSISNQIFLNSDYMNRIFKVESGMTITEYITQERIKLAKELLLKSAMPISLIASSVGYNNFSNFTQMFKKNVGISPLDYRKEAGR
ncbi:response regulator [Cohnella fermenti]|nr:response regulator [Cohnella fermenti]